MGVPGGRGALACPRPSEPPLGLQSQAISSGNQHGLQQADRAQRDGSSGPDLSSGNQLRKGSRRGGWCPKAPCAEFPLGMPGEVQVP